MDLKLQWRKTFKSYVTKEFGYKQSRVDPTGLHELRMTWFSGRFKFCMHKKFQELADGNMFNGRRNQQGQDGNIRVDMGKFIEERLHPMAIPKERRSSAPTRLGRSRVYVGQQNHHAQGERYARHQLQHRRRKGDPGLGIEVPPYSSSRPKLGNCYRL